MPAAELILLVGIGLVTVAFVLLLMGARSQKKRDIAPPPEPAELERAPAPTPTPPPERAPEPPRRATPPRLVSVPHPPPEPPRETVADSPRSRAQSGGAQLVLRPEPQAQPQPLLQPEPMRRPVTASPPPQPRAPSPPPVPKPEPMPEPEPELAEPELEPTPVHPAAASRSALAAKYLSPANPETAELEANDPRHAAARRLARLTVSEIKLYREADVKAGREARDLWRRLGSDLTMALQMFEKRVDQEVRERFDYLYDEILRQLAQGDPSTLGSDAPRPRKG
jgi:hypothetical protein